MKSALLACLMLTSALAFADDNFYLKQKVRNTTGEAVVTALLIDYTSTSDSFFCTFRNEDGRRYPITDQIVYVIDEKNDSNFLIPENLNDRCKKTMRNGSLGLFKKGLIQNLDESGDRVKKIRDNVYKIKGSLGTRMLGFEVIGGQENNLNCKLTSSLSLDCGSNKIQTDGLFIRLDIEITK